MREAASPQHRPRSIGQVRQTGAPDWITFAGRKKPAPHPRPIMAEPARINQRLGHRPRSSLHLQEMSSKFSRRGFCRIGFCGSKRMILLEKSAAVATRCSENLQRISSGCSLTTCCNVIELHAMHQARPRLPGRLVAAFKLPPSPVAGLPVRPRPPPAPRMLGLHIEHRCLHIYSCVNLDPLGLVHDPDFSARRTRFGISHRIVQERIRSYNYGNFNGTMISRRIREISPAGLAAVRQSDRIPL